jgi:Molecular chaperone, HSP90 family
LKESESEFLDGYRIRSIVRKFSDHISLPIVMDKEVPPSMGGEEGEEENRRKSSKKPLTQLPHYGLKLARRFPMRRTTSFTSMWDMIIKIH